MNRPAASLLCLLACSAVFNQVDANTKDEVKIEVVYRPDDCHRKSKRGDALNAHFDGYLAEDGSQIYCSREDNEGHPKWFLLGVGQVIKGLDIGMLDMCEGEKRKLIIPPSLAYGIIGKEEVYPTTSPMICKSIHACCKKRHSGLVRVECMYLFQYGKVPPNAILMFEIELYSVRNGPRSVESFNVIDLDGDRLLSQDELRSYVYEEFKRDNRIQDPTYKDKVLNDILRKNDHDGDGYISAREYNVFQHDEL